VASVPAVIVAAFERVVRIALFLFRRSLGLLCGSKPSRVSFSLEQGVRQYECTA
jgi:hypothetical protein